MEIFFKQNQSDIIDLFNVSRSRAGARPPRARVTFPCASHTTIFNDQGTSILSSGVAVLDPANSPL